MTRRLANQLQTPAPLATDLPGGAPGLPPDASTKIHQPGETSGSAAPPEDVPQLLSKRYKVKNDPPAGKPGFPVLYDGCLTHLPKGKIVDAGAYDIGLLERQGVELEEMK
jgi:hypothetical protein